MSEATELAEVNAAGEFGSEYDACGHIRKPSGSVGQELISGMPILTWMAAASSSQATSRALDIQMASNSAS